MAVDPQIGRHVVEWDLGLQGLAVLAAISLGFGAIAGLIVGRGVAYRLLATAITTVACFGVGLVTSEALFGWATGVPVSAASCGRSGNR